MPLYNYNVNRDLFEERESEHFSFPCYACKHRSCDEKEEPCSICDHNMNAIPDGEPK